MTKRNAFWLFLRLALLLALASCTPRGPQSKASDEQSVFSAEEDKVERPVAVPSAVLKTLSEDPDVQQVLETERLTPENLPDTWFLASEVHLGSADERDLVVIGTGHLRGANVTSFWLFRHVQDRFDPLMKATAHTLTIRETRSNGLRDVEAASAAAGQVSSVVYKFNGETYRPKSFNSSAAE